MTGSATRRSGRGAGSVRIIGGDWRRRRLTIPAVDGLRPTVDRIRETLFNWLAPRLPGANCLDLFAGTGALGFEAASRGAAEVVMVECEAKIAGALRDNASALDAAQVQIVEADALVWLAGEKRRFDIVFLDPPFAEELISVASAALAEGWLAAPACVYLEHPRGTPPSLPQGWRLERSKQAGRVQFALAEIHEGKEQAL